MLIRTSISWLGVVPLSMDSVLSLLTLPFRSKVLKSKSNNLQNLRYTSAWDIGPMSFSRSEHTTSLWRLHQVNASLHVLNERIPFSGAIPPFSESKIKSTPARSKSAWTPGPFWIPQSTKTVDRGAKLGTTRRKHCAVAFSRR
ncbi:hypothetical protein IW261DRAFT_1462342 [Armillaria novae-zelandiae]|uniref:Secreted protein n=1 Tax=Armillaria novae-zelandiae TaxID=153914 RepID=A0AA39PFF0_9AGAR|nr:hypothetical protein IW261DRAFT_1462342 [Armillaria novae-zelandiae]